MKPLYPNDEARKQDAEETQRWFFRRAMMPTDFGVGKPTLDLNFMTGTLPSLVTLTRATARKRFDGSGFLVTDAINAPSFDYSPTNVGTLLGLKIEPAATNLLLHSAMESGWTFTSASFTQAAATGPDNVASSAVKLVAAAATAQHFGTIAAITIVGGSTNTFSVWLQAAEETQATIKITDGSFTTGCQATVNLTTGVVSSTTITGTGTVVASAAVVCPNGWTRFSITGTIDASSTTARVSIFLRNGASYAGDGTSGCNCAFAQIEAGQAATSYIATTAATASRSADVVTVATSLFAFNSAGNTLMCSVMPAIADTAVNRTFVEFDDGTTNNRVLNRMSTSGVSSFLMVSGGVASANFAPAGTLTANTLGKVATSWALADAATTLNASVVATSAAGTPLPVGVTTLRIGDGTSAGSTFNGWIQRVKYWNYRTPNNQLAALTS